MPSISDPAFATAQGILDQLRLQRDDRDLGVHLTIAVGILLADTATGPTGLVQVAMAKLVMQIAFNRRAQELLLADCQGSA